MSLTIMSANLGNKTHDVKRRRQRAELRRFRDHDHPDVICLQEALLGLRVRGYRELNATGPGSHQVPILVRKDARVTGQLFLRAHGGERFKWPARWVHAAVVNDVAVVNTHLNSRIELNGQPRRGDKERLQLTLSHIALLRRLGKFFESWTPTVFAGDWNVDSDADQRVEHRRFPARSMERVQLREIMLPVGTLGARHVDRFFVSEDLDVVRRKALVKHGPFDHRPVLVEVEKRR